MGLRDEARRAHQAREAQRRHDSAHIDEVLHRRELEALEEWLAAWSIRADISVENPCPSAPGTFDTTIEFDAGDVALVATRRCVLDSVDRPGPPVYSHKVTVQGTSEEINSKADLGAALESYRNRYHTDAPTPRQRRRRGRRRG